MATLPAEDRLDALVEQIEGEDQQPAQARRPPLRVVEGDMTAQQREDYIDSVLEATVHPEKARKARPPQPSQRRSPQPKQKKSVEQLISDFVDKTEGPDEEGAARPKATANQTQAAKEAELVQQAQLAGVAHNIKTDVAQKYDMLAQAQQLVAASFPAGCPAADLNPQGFETWHLAMAQIWDAAQEVHAHAERQKHALAPIVAEMVKADDKRFDAGSDDIDSQTLPLMLRDLIERSGGDGRAVEDAWALDQPVNLLDPFALSLLASAAQHHFGKEIEPDDLPNAIRVYLASVGFDDNEINAIDNGAGIRTRDYRTQNIAADAVRFHQVQHD